MKFNEKYIEYKYKYIINEGTFNTLLPIIQKNYFEDCEYDVQSYNDLTDSDKKSYNEFIEWVKHSWESLITSITNNQQYRSWLYDIAKEFLIKGNSKVLFDSSDEIKLLLIKFQKICKSPKLTKEQRNILSYKSIDELTKFVDDFTKSNAKYLMDKKLPFRKIYSDGLYDVYNVYLNDKDTFQQLYGEYGYKCGWCIVNPERDMFEHYIQREDDCYRLITIHNTTKPFGLVHINSNQFKDIHNIAFNISQLTQEQLKSICDILNLVYKQTYDNPINGMMLNSSGDLAPFNNLIIKKNMSIDQIVDHFLFYLHKCNDGTYKSDISIASKDLRLVITNGKLDIKFNYCDGNFHCDDLNLKTLEGSPSTIFGTYDCSLNSITNLKGSPYHIDEDYLLYDCNDLTSLEGISNTVIRGELYISHCTSLTKIDYIPKSVKSIVIVYCPNLTDVSLLSSLNPDVELTIDNIGLSREQIIQQTKREG